MRIPKPYRYNAYSERVYVNRLEFMKEVAQSYKVT